MTSFAAHQPDARHESDHGDHRGDEHYGTHGISSTACDVEPPTHGATDDDSHQASVALYRHTFYGGDVR